MSNLPQLIREARWTITESLKESKNPCVLWSGGKDSMALLHLIRDTLPLIPVVCYREPWMQGEKLRFTNEVIRRWDLVAWDYAPSRVALCDGNGRTDILNFYQIGRGEMANQLVVARGTYPPVEGEPWICGRDTFLTRPTGTFEFPWDLSFVGHKSCDVDPTSGNIPLSVDLLHTANSTTLSYPLRNWSDAEVFQYLEENDVPIDPSRYEKIDDEWRSRPSKHSNPDYYATCLKCCDPAETEFVRCPKSGLDIKNIHEHTTRISPSLSYCGLRSGQEALQ